MAGDLPLKDLTTMGSSNSVKVSSRNISMEKENNVIVNSKHHQRRRATIKVDSKATSFKSPFVHNQSSNDTINNTPSTSASTPSSLSTIGSSKRTSPFHGTTRGEFYAIRRGYGVENCIFTSWENAKPHVEGGKEEDAVYNVFDRMEEAMLYIQAVPKTTKKKTATPNIKTVTISNDRELKKDRLASTKRHRTVKNIAKAVTDHCLSTVANKDSRDLQEILKAGYEQNRPKGWRQDDIFPGERQDRELWEGRYMKDVESLKAYRALSPADTRTVHCMNHASGIPNAYCLAYLNWSWGVGEAYHRYLAYQQRKEKRKNSDMTTTVNGITDTSAVSLPKRKKQRTKNNKVRSQASSSCAIRNSKDKDSHTCVITNREAARKRFTAKAMFYSFRVQQLINISKNKQMVNKAQLSGRPSPFTVVNQSPLVHGCNTRKELMDQARADWDRLSHQDQQYWVEQELLHDAQQPQIMRLLEASLARDPKRSAKKLSEDIGYWCGKTTIGKWKNLRMGPSYCHQHDAKSSNQDIHRFNQDLDLMASTALASLKQNKATAYIPEDPPGDKYAQPYN